MEKGAGIRTTVLFFSLSFCETCLSDNVNIHCPLLTTAYVEENIYAYLLSPTISNSKLYGCF